MMAAKHTKPITRLLLQGYKSIADCDIQLGRFNVLIGANGSGKTNFLDFFRLLGRVLKGQLQQAVGEMGGPDALLRFGRKQTPTINAKLYFGDDDSYQIRLSPTQDNRMMFVKEMLQTDGLTQDYDGHYESRLSKGVVTRETLSPPSPVGQTGIAVHESLAQYEHRTIRNGQHDWRLYHFNDTSDSARLKQIQNINDNEFLREDGSNLAAFLLRLRDYHSSHYQQIVQTIRLVAPFFGDFHLRPMLANTDTIQLEWSEKGSDEPFTAATLSDGSLRFICLATLLLQPAEFMPSIMLIDEPELGLHPLALALVAALLDSAADHSQLLVTTQSAELIDHFDPEDLIVVDRQQQQSVFKRLNTEQLREWLDDYTLGYLWRMGHLGGG